MIRARIGKVTLMRRTNCYKPAYKNDRFLGEYETILPPT
jgi:hypothetical protein